MELISFHTSQVFYHWYDMLQSASVDKDNFQYTVNKVWPMYLWVQDIPNGIASNIWK